MPSIIYQVSAINGQVFGINLMYQALLYNFTYPETVLLIAGDLYEWLPKLLYQHSALEYIYKGQSL